MVPEVPTEVPQFADTHVRLLMNADEKQRRDRQPPMANLADVRRVRLQATSQRCIVWKPQSPFDVVEQGVGIELRVLR